MHKSLPSVHWFSGAIERLSKKIALPTGETTTDGEKFRFVEKSIEQAIFLKTARYVSGLHACELLLNKGFHQEMAALQRMLDEIQEDTIFLALGRAQNEITDLHKKFLTSFWEEEPSLAEFLDNPLMKDQVPRKKIQAFISRARNAGKGDYDEIATAKYMLRIYSGFVHAAAAQSIELYDPSLRKFRVSGYSHLREVHFDDFQNYIFRGLIVVIFCANALGDETLQIEANGLHDVALRSDSGKFHPGSTF